MRATRVPADKQFRLIMECRANGLTDHVFFATPKYQKRGCGDCSLWRSKRRECFPFETIDELKREFFPD